MVRPSAPRPVRGAHPHLIIMDEVATYNEYGDRVPATQSLPLPKPAVAPFSPEDERITREAWRHLSQSPRDDLKNAPALVVRQAEIHTGATVMVMWGESRGMVGVVTGRRDGGYYIRKLDGPGESGLVIPDALGVVLNEAPTFDSAEEAEDWLLRSGEQEWFPGDMVRVSERRDREQMIVHGRIVKYLGIQGKEPPKYLIDIHGEPKITASYFIKGRV